MRTRGRILAPTSQPVAASPRSWGVEHDMIVYSANDPAFAVIGDYAVVEVCGGLEARDSMRGDSYESIRRRFAAALESDRPAVVLRISSPGGDFAGSIELGAELRAMASAAGKRYCAFTDGQMSSAAYAVACGAEAIYATPTAMVGSIGVWAALCDTVSADRAQGLNVRVVASGARKADHNPHVPISEGVVDYLQVQIDAMAGMFFDHVATMRGVPAEAVAALEGGELLAEDAQARGLLDEVVTSWDTFVKGESLAATPSATREGTTMPKSSKMSAIMGAHRAALAKLAAEDSDDGKEARAALYAMDQEEPAAESTEETAAKAEEPAKEEPKAEEPPKEEAKAEAPPAKEDEPKKEEAKAFSLLERVHALESAAAAKAEADERHDLLAKRPDFSPQVRTTLAEAPIEFVRKAVSTWPRGTTPAASSAAALTPPATRGATQGDPGSSFVGATQDDYIARKMGMAQATGKITNEGRSLSLGFLTPEQVAAEAKRLGLKDGDK